MDEQLKTVPYGDYLIVLQIRLMMAQGTNIAVLPLPTNEPKNSEFHYDNARMLHTYYGLSTQQILELTGFYIPEKTVRQKIKGIFNKFCRLCEMKVF